MVSSPFSTIPNFFITVNDASPTTTQEENLTTFLSTEYSYALLETVTDNSIDDQMMDVGTTIVVKIVPMSNNNSSMMISEHCTALNSFYTVSDGQSGEYQGVFNTIEDEQESKAGFIKLTAFILRSGTLTVHPRITCGSKYEYPITCLGQSNDQVCQKIVKPLPATTLKVMVVRDHET